MKIWYLSQTRFEKRIIDKWTKSGVSYNSGNVNILKYAYRAVRYWASLENQKISEVNKIETNNLKLF